MVTPINFSAMKSSSEVVSPAVITSKSASKDLLNIQTQHADIVRGMADQKLRVDAYNQQKQAELQAQNSMQAEMEKERMVVNTDIQKNAMDFAQKQGELDVKRSALSMKM